MRQRANNVAIILGIIYYYPLFFRWGYPHLYNPLSVSGLEALRGFGDKTEARLSPGIFQLYSAVVYSSNYDL
jgi:hypothetical protein